ncbi:hypothetical protein [Chamaesiphon sp. OTE_8_metabat_110]|uniref:hypothetical protein n=1 Tax=Chamaesiphon sp. OTE_8_metabat_110 TaxID=2964696 RepID=UPI00286CDDEA|nr:hypothetical protein [Chamaesiphon sp. OTE_8_metabat_110]
MAIEAFDAPGAIDLGKIYPPRKLRLLIDQTAKMREDPNARKERLDKASAIEFIDKFKDDIFVADDGEELSLAQFL